MPKLLHLGHQVTVVDAQWFGNYLQPHPALTVIKAADIRELVDMRGQDVIVHLAAIANDPSCDLDARLTWEVNCLATQRLADAAAKAGAEQFIYASSGSVYGISDALEVTEDTPLIPLSDYNRTKIVAERVVLSYVDKMAVQIVRPATVCGMSPRMRFDTVVNVLTIQALSKDLIRMDGGGQSRPNIHIQDMADLYVWLIDHPTKTGVFNAGFENLTVRAIAHTVADRFNVPVIANPTNDIRSYRLNSDRLLAAGFRPKHSVADAISEIAEAYNAGLVSDAPHHHNVGWMMQMDIA